jgi:hypothetical protein
MLGAVTPAIPSSHRALALLAAFAIVFAPAPLDGSPAERTRPLEAPYGRILAPTVREGRVALASPVVRPDSDRFVAVAAAGLAALLLFAMRPAWLGRLPSAIRPRTVARRSRIARGPPAPRMA